MILLLWLALIAGCIGIAAWLLRHPGEEPVKHGTNGNQPPEPYSTSQGRKLVPPRNPNRAKRGF